MVRVPANSLSGESSLSGLPPATVLLFFTWLFLSAHLGGRREQQRALVPLSPPTGTLVLLD
jgi:hypothetical protein